MSKPGIRPAVGTGPSREVRDSVTAWMQAIAPYGIFTTDTELRVLSWNQWLVTHSGFNAAQVIGRPLADIFPELAQRRLMSRYSRALAGEISVLSTALHQHLLPFPTSVAVSDHPFMLQTARIAPLPGLEGISGTITIIEDVTQREFQAASLRRQHDLDRLLSTALGALLQAEEPGQEITKIIAPLMPSFGLDAYFCYLWNAEAGNFRLHSASGVSPKQREGLSTLGMAREDHPLARGAPRTITATTEKHSELLQGLGVQPRGCWPLAVGERIIGFVSFGSYQWESSRPVDDSLLTRVAHFLAIAIDRSAKEREAIAASRAKNDFLAALSHELRTPLNPVLLVASDGVNNPDFPADARSAFRIIEKNAQLEARLIDDLLDLTRIEHGKLSLELQLVDAHAVVRDAIATIRADAEEKHLALHLDLAAPRSTLLGDPARLQQVFWNVLKNGIKFTQPGGKLWISTSLDDGRHEWTLQVVDTGIGMETHELARVFDAFAQGDHAGSRAQSHRFGGLGLGLAICQKLVQLHSGRIEALSAGKDRGSTFRVHFPLAPATPEAARPDPRPGEARGGDDPRPGTRYRILLVEDHASTRKPLTKLLERRGYEVVPTGTATEALEAAAQGSFDLVLSDIGLPDLDGFELMKLLRTRHRLVGIALTGYGMESDVANSSAAGFIAHLTKPINMTLLERTLRTVLPAAPASS